MKIEKPKNQWALCIWLLMNHYTEGVTMVEAMKVYFHKYQTRLLEIEKGREAKLKMTRLPITKKNRFGHSTTFTRYKSNANFKYLENLYLKLNRQGLKP